MAISVFELFSIGIGPSSSHTVGPMRAAREFAAGLLADLGGAPLGSVETRLYGSLAATGRGHGTDRAVTLGLMGDRPETVDVASIEERLAAVRRDGVLPLLGQAPTPFDAERHLVFDRGEELPGHPNGMRFTARGSGGEPLREAVYFSLGGGFIVTADENGSPRVEERDDKLPHPFTTAVELLERCAELEEPISGVMMRNEGIWRDGAAIRAGLLDIWRAMQECVEAGCRADGEMPGLGVRRRAGDLYRQLSHRPEASLGDPLSVMDWVNLYALAVNEENAGGGRVVTAPTNGAAGIIPAVLHYYTRFCPGATDEGVIRFLLTAGAIGVLFKRNASISGAEVGCQGEVGSACSMAAGALTEALGGSPQQAENAAEIAMEHNLGLTCDPIGGYVQVPCIERNAMASVKAINAARLALRGDGRHFVSLDKVIKTMRDTGRDMKTKYKETSRGGLAVNVIEC